MASWTGIYIYFQLIWPTDEKQNTVYNKTQDTEEDIVDSLTKPRNCKKQIFQEKQKTKTCI